MRSHVDDQLVPGSLDEGCEHPEPWLAATLLIGADHRLGDTSSASEFRLRQTSGSPRRTNKRACFHALTISCIVYIGDF